jgi:hydrogenase maturation factor
VPQHSFNVIYVGVGKVTGSVPTNIENINNCLIRPAKVISSAKKSLIARHRTYTHKEGVLVLGDEKESEFECLEDYEAGETVAVHWGFAVDRLTTEQESQLIKYTGHNISCLKNKKD